MCILGSNVGRRGRCLRPPRRDGSVLRIAFLALLAFIAAGCTRSTAPVDRVPINEQVRAVAAEVSALRAQMDTVIAACLRSEGFPYFPRTARQHFATLTGLYSIRVGISVEDARAKGYSPDPASATGEAEQKYFEGLSQAEQNAYALAHLGTERDMVEYTSPSGAQSSFAVGGCTGVAANHVYGGKQAYVDASGLFDELQFMAANILMRAEEDEAFREAMTKWSACMADAGYSFKTPTDARNAGLQTRKKLSEAEYGPPTPKEIAIASADARCQDEVSLREVFLQVALREQQSITDEKERLFLAWDELTRRVAASGNTSVKADSQDVLSAGADGGG